MSYRGKRKKGKYIQYAGKTMWSSKSIKEYAATIEFSPIVTLGIIVLCVPILQFLSSIIDPFLLSIVECE